MSSGNPSWCNVSVGSGSGNGNGSGIGSGSGGILASSCDTFGSNSSECLSACVPCIFNLTSSKCSTLTHCSLQESSAILLNAAARLNCSLGLNPQSDSSESSSDSGLCGTVFILPIVYLSLFSVCCFCAAPYRYRSPLIRRILLLFSVPSWVAFVALSFLYRASVVSCDAFAALMYILIVLLCPAGIAAVAVLCGAEERLESRRLKRILKKKEAEERRKKAAERKAIQQLFHLNPFAEKYVLRIILEYEGRFVEEELDAFAHMHKQLQSQSQEAAQSNIQTQSTTAADSLQSLTSIVVATPLQLNNQHSEEGKSIGLHHHNASDHNIQLAVSVAVDHSHPSRQSTPSVVEMEEMAVRFHFSPTLPDADNNRGLSAV